MIDFAPELTYQHVGLKLSHINHCVTDYSEKEHRVRALMQTLFLPALYAV